MKILKKNHLKIIIFTAVKYCSIMHGHVCVMNLSYPTFQWRLNISVGHFISQSVWEKMFENCGLTTDNGSIYIIRLTRGPSAQVPLIVMKTCKRKTVGGHILLFRLKKALINWKNAILLFLFDSQFENRLV